jgi:hypothetical protein
MGFRHFTTGLLLFTGHTWDNCIIITPLAAVCSTLYADFVPALIAAKHTMRSSHSATPDARWQLVDHDSSIVITVSWVNNILIGNCRRDMRDVCGESDVKSPSSKDWVGI